MDFKISRELNDVCFLCVHLIIDNDTYYLSNNNATWTDCWTEFSDMLTWRPTWHQPHQQLLSLKHLKVARQTFANSVSKTKSTGTAVGRAESSDVWLSDATPDSGDLRDVSAPAKCSFLRQDTEVGGCFWFSKNCVIPPADIPPVVRHLRHLWIFDDLLTWFVDDLLMFPPARHGGSWWFVVYKDRKSVV